MSLNREKEKDYARLFYRGETTKWNPFKNAFKALMLKHPAQVDIILGRVQFDEAGNPISITKRARPGRKANSKAMPALETVVKQEGKADEESDPSSESAKPSEPVKPRATVTTNKQDLSDEQFDKYVTANEGIYAKLFEVTSFKVHNIFKHKSVPFGHGYGAWETLLQKYEKLSRGKKREFQAAINSLQMQARETIEDYVGRMFDLEQLLYNGWGKAYDEDDRLTFLLSGLDEKRYSTTITIIDSDETIDYDGAVAALEKFEERMLKAWKNNGLMKSKTNDNSGRQTDGRSKAFVSTANHCDACGETTHTYRNCKNKQNLECDTCNKKGHATKMCWKTIGVPDHMKRGKSSKNGKSANVTEQANVTETKTNVVNDDYLNWGMIAQKVEKKQSAKKENTNDDKPDTWNPLSAESCRNAAVDAVYDRPNLNKYHTKTSYQLKVDRNKFYYELKHLDEIYERRNGINQYDCKYWNTWEQIQADIIRRGISSHHPRDEPRNHSTPVNHRTLNEEEDNDDDDTNGNNDDNGVDTNPMHIDWGTNSQDEWDNEDMFYDMSESDSDTDYEQQALKADKQDAKERNSQNMITWVIDSGASDNFCKEPKHVFTNYLQNTSDVKFGGGGVANSPGTGIVHGIEDVLHVPGMTHNLLSVRILSSRGFAFVFDAETCKIVKPNGKTLGTAKVQQGLYKISLPYKFDASANIADAKPQNDAYLWHQRLGHINYITLKNSTRGKNVKLHGVKIDPKAFDDKEGIHCDTCHKSKITKTGLPTKPSKRETKALKRLSVDLLGPVGPRARSGAKYVLVIVDDATRYAWVRFISNKSDATAILKEFIGKLEKSMGKVGLIEILRSDNGTEFLNHEMDKFLKENNITRELTVPNNSGQNAISERFIRTLTTRGRCLLVHAQLQANLWDESTAFACHVYNRLPHTANKMQTPIFKLKNETPNLNYIRTFGCKVTVLDEKVSKKNRFSPRGKGGRFLGYTSGVKGYRIMMNKTGKIRSRRHVVFNELPSALNKPAATPMTSMKRKKNTNGNNEDGGGDDSASDNDNEKKVRFNIPAAPVDKRDADEKVTDAKSVDKRTPDEKIATSEAKDATEEDGENSPQDDVEENDGRQAPNEEDSESESGNDDEQKHHNTPDEPKRPRRTRTQVVKLGHHPQYTYFPTYDPKDFEEEKEDPHVGLHTFKITNTDGREKHIDLYALAAHESSATLVHGNDVITPKTYKQATSDSNPHKKEWIAAVKRELKAMSDMGVWVPETLPADRKAIKSTWVFKAKLDNDGNVKKFKARLCARGDMMIQGIDYTQTYAPVSRLPSVRIFIISMVKKNYTVVQLDVSTAYLYATLKETVYMKMPQGMENEKFTCLRLVKSLYGLCQSANAWHLELKKTLIKFGMKPLISDPCVYYYQENGEEVYMLTYVDDLLAAGTTRLRNRLLDHLKSTYTCTQEDELVQMLGMRVNIDYKTKTVSFDVETYLEGVLTRFALHDSKPVATPMVTQQVKESQEELYPNVKQFMQATGSLMYASLTARPDITFAVVKLARKMAKPTLADWIAMKRIMRYIRGTTHLKLNYNCAGRVKLLATCDADWGGDEKTSRSTSGGAIFILDNSAPTEWISKLQRNITLSTAIAELNSIVVMVKMTIWTCLILKEMGLPALQPVVKSDNTAAIRIAEATCMHSKVKHALLKVRFLQELIKEHKLRVEHIPTLKNPADAYTKALPRPKFESMRDQLNMPGNNATTITKH